MLSVAAVQLDEFLSHRLPQFTNTSSPASPRLAEARIFLSLGFGTALALWVASA
jgi:hypothetical protein